VTTTWLLVWNRRLKSTGDSVHFHADIISQLQGKESEKHVELSIAIELVVG